MGNSLLPKWAISKLLPNQLTRFFYSILIFFFSYEPAWPMNTLNDSRMTSELGQTWHSLNSKSIYFEVKSEILSKCQHALLIYVYVMISTILTLLLKNIWTWSVLSFTHLPMEKKRALSMQRVSNCLLDQRWSGSEPEVTKLTSEIFLTRHEQWHITSNIILRLKCWIFFFAPGATGPIF